MMHEVRTDCHVSCLNPRDDSDFLREWRLIEAVRDEYRIGTGCLTPVGGANVEKLRRLAMRRAAALIGGGRGEPKRVRALESWLRGGRVGFPGRKFLRAPKLLAARGMSRKVPPEVALALGLRCDVTRLG
jgi:hypothetical protein